MKRVAAVIDDYALRALPGLDAALARAGAVVMRSFRGLPNPQLLRRLPGYHGTAVVGGSDQRSLVSRLETATLALAAPVIAALPPGVEPSPELRGPGVVDLIPAGTRGAAERVMLMARVPIVSSARRAAPEPARAAAPADPARAAPTSAAGREPPAHVVGVASSTGGVWPLAELLRGLWGRGDAAVLVAQHMEPDFVAPFAEWLGAVTGWRAAVVLDPEPLAPGVAYVAAGGRDLCVAGAEVLGAPPSSRFVPSADRLLRSLAASYGPRASGAVLSGMGSDGAEGLAEIARCGGRAACQLPGTAVVPSMPESALRRTPSAIAAAPEGLAAALRR